LEILSVGRRPFIQDYQIDGELLHSPVFMSEKYLVDDLQVAGFIDANQNNRQVAGDPMDPKHRRGSAASLDYLGGWPRPRIGKEHTASEALEEVRFSGANSEMTELHLSLSPSQCRRAIERAGVAMPVHKIEHFFAGSGD
jgi:hypothetical protein